MTLAKDLPPLMTAESFLNAQSGSLQKWLKLHATKESFLKQSAQTCSIASLAWKEKSPPNSQSGRQRQVLGSLVCLTHLLAVTNLQQVPNISEKCVIAEGPCRWSGQAPRARGARGERSAVPARFGNKEPTLTLQQPGEEEGARPSRRQEGRQAGNNVCCSNLGWQGRHCRLLYLAYIGALFCLTRAIFWGSGLSPQSLGGSVGGEEKVARRNKTTTIFTLAQHRDLATFGTDLENYLAASVEKWKIKWYLSLI